MKTAQLRKQNSYIRMPWGKHRGKYLREIPDAYIEWAIMNFDDAGMAEIMAVELSRRRPDLR